MKELVLLGGGHAHVEVLRRWGGSPVQGVRVTLVTNALQAPYSGMLPGLVSGVYTFQQCHIDLARLAASANAAVVHQEARGIDLQARQVLLQDAPPVSYDVLSLNLGITPAAAAVPGAAAHATAVKPISGFVERFKRLLARATASARPLSVAVVGGGAGGVELALALAYRLQQERRGMGGSSAAMSQHTDTVKLFCSGRILPGHSAATAAALRAQAAARGVVLHEHSSVAEVQQGSLRTSDGVLHAADEVLWCTQAAAAGWLQETGLPLDASGFVCISDTLQSEGGPPEVFAVGDVASSTRHPRPKAGVYAVRQGPPLHANLCRYLQGEALQPYVPQQQALALISAGDRYAVSSYGSWPTLQGRWLWSVKDCIDRAFMRRYS